MGKSMTNNNRVFHSDWPRETSFGWPVFLFAFLSKISVVSWDFLRRQNSKMHDDILFDWVDLSWLICGCFLNSTEKAAQHFSCILRGLWNVDLSVPLEGFNRERTFLLTSVYSFTSSLLDRSNNHLWSMCFSTENCACERSNDALLDPRTVHSIDDHHHHSFERDITLQNSTEHKVIVQFLSMLLIQLFTDSGCNFLSPHYLSFVLVLHRAPCHWWKRISMILVRDETRE